MSDRYAQLVRTPVGGRVAKGLGLPRPARLRRYDAGAPALDGPVLVGPVGGRLTATVAGVAADAGLEVLSQADPDVAEDAAPGAQRRYAALVLDASGVETVAGLGVVRDFLAPVLRRLAPSGRVVVLGTPPEDAGGLAAAAAQEALAGVVRSLAKELRAGATANLVYVARGAEAAAATTLEFFLSARSAFVDGQVVRLAAPAAEPPAETSEPDRDRPQDGRVAVVTGAAKGIGAAIAATLARDGAHVVCVDVPAQGERLAATANRVGGTALQLDVTAAGAPDRLAAHLRERHGGVDVVVHNAGITRDKLLANMDAARWDAVLTVNLEAQLRLTEAVTGAGLLRPGGRIVCVSSTNGIAGARGQTNYGASKAGVIGLVRALAPALAPSGATVNAVAPGFIETEMTAAMPFGAREVARRLSSLGQGGLPVDVAETVAWLAQPGSGGVNGQVVRVCGQLLVGA